MFTSQQETAVIQNLIDAQCPRSTIQAFVDMWNAGEFKEAIFLLARHRASLLQNLHEAQKPLDNLDYLIHKLKRKRDDQ